MGGREFGGLPAAFAGSDSDSAPWKGLAKGLRAGSATGRVAEEKKAQRGGGQICWCCVGFAANRGSGAAWPGDAWGNLHIGLCCVPALAA